MRMTGPRTWKGNVLFKRLMNIRLSDAFRFHFVSNLQRTSQSLASWIGDRCRLRKSAIPHAGKAKGIHMRSHSWLHQHPTYLSSDGTYSCRPSTSRVKFKKKRAQVYGTTLSRLKTTTANIFFRLANDPRTSLGM